MTGEELKSLIWPRERGLPRGTLWSGHFPSGLGRTRSGLALSHFVLAALGPREDPCLSYCSQGLADGGRCPELQEQWLHPGPENCPCRKFILGQEMGALSSMTLWTRHSPKAPLPGSSGRWGARGPLGSLSRA